MISLLNLPEITFSFSTSMPGQKIVSFKTSIMDGEGDIEAAFKVNNTQNLQVLV